MQDSGSHLMEVIQSQSYFEVNDFLQSTLRSYLNAKDKMLFRTYFERDCFAIIFHWANLIMVQKMFPLSRFCSGLTSQKV